MFFFFLIFFVASLCVANSEGEVEAVESDLILYSTSFRDSWFVDCNTGVDDEGATRMLKTLERVVTDQNLPSMQVDDEPSQGKQSR